MRFPVPAALGVFAALVALAAPAPRAAGAASEPPRQLERLRRHLHVLERDLNAARGQRVAVRDRLRRLDQDINERLATLATLQGEQRADRDRLARLQAHRASAHRLRAAQTAALDREARAAFALGREDYLKLLLSDRDPSALDRELTYYRYFLLWRRQRLASIRATLARLDNLEARIHRRQQHLAALGAQQRQQAQALAAARDRRTAVLATLNRRIENRSQEIQRLRASEKRLERLFGELRPYLAGLPPPPAGASMRRYRGRLPLPLQGRVLARFGEPKHLGDLKWRGLLLAAPAGRPVRAVFPGRVVYAGWLRGFGLLLILDHGDGYMTLYGDNQRLRKQVGDWVEGGETIATVGNTGDPSQPGLYFEVRHNGKPLDPLIWCKAR